MSDWEVIQGDCLDAMPNIPENSIDAIVTDPPYGLAFMGKAWDHAVPGPEFFAAMLRVAKPGAHLVAFGGTRLYHRMTVAIEDAGWEVRDSLMWLYGSGFPKSHDVSKAIDRKAGAEREVLGVSSVTGERRNAGSEKYGGGNGIPQSINLLTAPATDEAKRWHGWGTALKPAWEPIVLARKPLDGTVAANHLRHGCGGLNVDGCRVGTTKDVPSSESTRSGYMKGWAGGHSDNTGFDPNTGRWPANLILGEGVTDAEWSRFFYCPKASKRDRDENNTHPTVKPTDLMRYLCRLVTPQGGTVLDPFTGSGSTGKAAILEGFNFIGIERDTEYVNIAKARIAEAQTKETLNV
jgi:DNA modification methylase